MTQKVIVEGVYKLDTIKGLAQKKEVHITWQRTRLQQMKSLQQMMAGHNYKHKEVKLSLRQIKWESLKVAKFLRHLKLLKLLMMVGHNYKHKEVKLSLHQINWESLKVAKFLRHLKLLKLLMFPRHPKFPRHLKLLKHPKFTRETPKATITKAPKVPKIPKALKANILIETASDNVPVDNVPIDNVSVNNVPVDHVSIDLIDPDMLAEILFDDEVPEMISKRLHCSAPVAVPLFSEPNVVPAASEPCSAPVAVSLFSEPNVVFVVSEPTNVSYCS